MIYAFLNRSFPHDLSTRAFRHERTSTTRVRHKRHMNDTSAIRALHKRHEWKILILITTRVKTYFHNPAFTIRQVKDYKERSNFNSKNYLFEMPCSHAKVRLKSATQKLNFVMAFIHYIVLYTLDCSCKWPCTFPHSYAH